MFESKFEPNNGSADYITEPLSDARFFGSIETVLEQLEMKS
jgi:hypothetical protein